MQREYLHLESIDEVWASIDADASVVNELDDLLTFEAHNHRFSPAYKKGYWDGKIRLVKRGKRYIRVYKGLTKFIEDFCDERDYGFATNYSNQWDEGINTEEFIENLHLTNDKGVEFELRDYQLVALQTALTQKRATILSPTASGKSAVLYAIVRFCLENTEGKILLLVPNISLVNQLYANFQDYSQINGFNTEDNVCKIYSGQDRDDTKRCWISTWQSMYTQEKEYFDDVQTVIYDEVHSAKAKEITSLLENIRFAEYRYGFTGTLDNVQCHELTTIGLFGPIHQVATTTDLIEANHISDFKIKCLHFQYPEDQKRRMKKNDWRDEVDVLISLKERNEMISKIALNLEGNVLILFSRIEHGKELHERISKNTTRPVHLIFGQTKDDIREDVREAVKNSTDSIIVASSQIFSAGIDINTLEYLIFAHPFNKSRVRILQSIGRILRKAHNKEIAIVLDLVDDLRIGTWKNYSYRHFEERVKLYMKEDFNFSNTTVQIKPKFESVLD